MPNFIVIHGVLEKRSLLNPVVSHVKQALMVSVLDFFIRLLMTDSLYISINKKSHVKLNSARISIERSRLKHFNSKTIFLFLKRILKQKVEVLRPFQVSFTVCIRSLGSLLAFDRQHPQTFTVPPKDAYRKSALLNDLPPCPFIVLASLTTKAVK